MESMFLPDFLYKGVSLATMKQEKMERKKIENLS